MVEIKPIDVCCSSQDPAFPALNLVLGASKPSDERKQWLCSSPDEKFAHVTLTYEKPFVISSLEIKNNGSAYVQVEGGSSDEPGKYKILWKTQNLMTPSESRQGTETEGTYIFLPQDLATADKDETWDVLKITCSQPFNKLQKYGLSHVIARSALPVKEEIPSSPSPCVADPPIPSFKQEPTDDEAINIVQVRKQQEKVSDPQNQMSSEVSSSGCSESLNSFTSPVKQENSSNGDAFFSSPRGSEPSSSSVPQANLLSPTIKRENSLHLNAESDSVPSETADSEEAVRQSSPLKRRISESDSSSDTNSDEVQVVKRPAPSNIIYKPFNKLLEGVKIVISGFQNPSRADIRTRALLMGASYSPHWTDSCTHLVCAFLYTPKYRQAALDNALIVTREWVDQCYLQRKRLPWKRFALNPSERSDTCGGVEIWELVSTPSSPRPSSSHIGSTTSPSTSSIVMENAPIHIICSNQSGQPPLPFRSHNSSLIVAAGVKKEVPDSAECSSAQPNLIQDIHGRVGTPRPTYLPNLCTSSPRQGISVKREISNEEMQDIWNESASSQHASTSAIIFGVEQAQTRRSQMTNTPPRHHLPYHSVPTASSGSVEHETLRSSASNSAAMESGSDGYAGYYRPISQPCSVPHSSPSATYLVPPVIMLPQTLPQYFVPVSQQFQAPSPARENYMTRTIPSPQVQSQHVQVIQHSNKPSEEQNSKQS